MGGSTFPPTPELLAAALEVDELDEELEQAARVTTVSATTPQRAMLRTIRVLELMVTCPPVRSCGCAVCAFLR